MADHSWADPNRSDLAREYHDNRKKTVARTNGKHPDWFAQCICGETGKPLPIVANALIALQAVMPDHFAYDEMACAPMLMEPLEETTLLSHPREDSTVLSPVTDVDVGIVQAKLQHMGLKRIGRDTVHQAVDMRAHACRFHPVRDYLDGLEWDGELRIGNCCASLSRRRTKTTTPEPSAACSSYRMVARIFEPGCKADHMLVIEGAQGTLKSTACDRLAGDWFSDNLPDVTVGKDVSQHLRGKWLIEVSEMHAMNRAEAAQLKASSPARRNAIARRYGRREVIEPRQCVFVGTTNRNTYLRDETGGRRFWPVKTGTINIEAWSATATSSLPKPSIRYREGAQWWPDKDFEREHIAPEQEARFEADAWEETIGTYVGTRSEVTIGEIARDGLGIETPRIGTAEQRRIAAALERLGWHREPVNWKGRIPWRRA